MFGKNWQHDVTSGAIAEIDLTAGEELDRIQEAEKQQQKDIDLANRIFQQLTDQSDLKRARIQQVVNQIEADIAAVPNADLLGLRVILRRTLERQLKIVKAVSWTVD